MGGAAVSLDRLGHRYRDRVALSALTASIAKGETVAFLGPNGSGKTTLFRILSTLMPPFEGKALVGGHDVAREPEAVRRRIGVLFQAPGLDKKLTVRENLVHQGYLYGLRGGDLASRADRLLDRVGLADRSEERVETLSGGLKRRVEIAKSLLHDPEVLLLDEPCAGLDPGARNDVWEALRELPGRGVTVLLTTHDMDEAARCARVAILDAGRLVALEPPRALVDSLKGGIVHLRIAGDLPSIARELEAEFQVQVEAGREDLLFVHPDAPGCLARTLARYGPAVVSGEVRRPTLEDVFLAKTGRPFWVDAQGGRP